MKENKLIDIKLEQGDKSILSRDNINILLESNRENLYSNINYYSDGLGFRASLPKMPSFRRKKIPSPVPEDEDDDTQKISSDNEEIVHYSDSDANRPPPRERKDSTSSNASSSSFSSSSDSDSSDESSSDSEPEIKQINRRSVTPTVEESKVESEDVDTFETFSPLRTGIEPSNKTPEPMQVSLINVFRIFIMVKVRITIPTVTKKNVDISHKHGF